MCEGRYMFYFQWNVRKRKQKTKWCPRSSSSSIKIMNSNFFVWSFCFSLSLSLSLHNLPVNLFNTFLIIYFSCFVVAASVECEDSLSASSFSVSQALLRRCYRLVPMASTPIWSGVCSIALRLTVITSQSKTCVNTGEAEKNGIK